jgi:hypothetical protein
MLARRCSKGSWRTVYGSSLDERRICIDFGIQGDLDIVPGVQSKDTGI